METENVPRRDAWPAPSKLSVPPQLASASRQSRQCGGTLRRRGRYQRRSQDAGRAAQLTQLAGAPWLPYRRHPAAQPLSCGSKALLPWHGTLQIGMAVGLGEDERLGRLATGREVLWKPVAESVDQRSYLIGFDDRRIELHLLLVFLLLAFPARRLRVQTDPLPHNWINDGPQ